MVAMYGEGDRKLSELYQFKFTNELYSEEEIESSLKLTKLVYEKIKLRKALKKRWYIRKSYTFNDVLEYQIQLCLSLLKDSETSNSQEIHSMERGN